MSKRIGVSGEHAVVVEDGPRGYVLVEPDAPVDGAVVTLPDGRTAKQVVPAEFESVFTLRTLRAEAVVDADPLAGYLADEPLRQVREGVRDERVAVWFASLPTDPAPETEPASDEVLAALGAALAGAAPEGWRGVVVECEALGSRMVVVATVTMADGTVAHWSPPAVVGQWLHRLRMREHSPDRGVWTRAVFELAPDAPPVRTEHSADAPAELSDEDAADELRLLPRSVVPHWLLAAALRSTQAQRADYAGEPEPLDPPELVRLFDGADATGRPTWYRPALGERERDAILTYLETALILLSGRGSTRDLLGTEESVVPMNFYTDGRYVWSGAVAYYLRAHGVPPATALVEHIRAARHQPPRNLPLLTLGRAVTVTIAGRRYDEAWADTEAREAMGPVESVIIDRQISPRHYSAFAEREDAWSLTRDGDRYRVQWSLDRYRAILFDDVRQAAAYLTGQLYANSANLGFETGEEIPAWQSPLIVLSDDPPIESFTSITSIRVENVEMDRYGDPDGNLAFLPGTPFDQCGLPAEYAERPFHRYRITGGPWKVLAVQTAAGGTGYVLPKAIDEYLRSGHIVEVDLSEQSSLSEQSGPSQQSSPSDHLGHTDLPGQSDHPGLPGHPDQASATDRPDHPGLPPITDPMRAEAARTPGGWVYCADPDADPRFVEGMPLPILLGGYKVGEDGQFTGETWINDDYRPSPRRRGYPEPRTNFELVLGYVAAGWLPHERILTAVLDSPFLLETDGHGGLESITDETGRRTLAAYSSPGYVPPNAQNIKQAQGIDLAQALSGVTLLINPEATFGIELPGDDLVRAANTQQHP